LESLKSSDARQPRVTLRELLERQGVRRHVWKKNLLR